MAFKPKSAQSSVKEPEDSRQHAASVFEGVERVGHGSCNRFTFPGQGPHAGNVEFWYSEQEARVSRLEVLPGLRESPPTGARVNVEDWSTEYRLGHVPPLAVPLTAWDCQASSEVEHTWLWLASQTPPSDLPAGHAIRKLASALGTVGVLAPEAADTLSRMVIVSPSSVRAREALHRTTVTTTTVTTTATMADLFGDSLDSMSFSFSSQFDGKPGNSHGQLRVDLGKRQLYLNSTAWNVSAGIPRLDSQLVLDMDRGRLIAKTRSSSFEQCYSVNIQEVVPPAAQGGARQNPFSRAKLVTRTVEPGQSEVAQFEYPLSRSKTVRLFTAGRTLVALNIIDTELGGTDSVLVGEDYSTGPIATSWFDVDRLAKTCGNLHHLEGMVEVARLDLVKVFFPAAEPTPFLQGRRTGDL